MKCRIKFLLSWCLVLALFSLRSYTLQSDDLQKEIIQPRFTYINVFQNSFNISNNGKATAEVFLYAHDVDQVEVQANIQQYNNGAWQTIKSWSSTQQGTSCRLGKSWYVESGYSYRLVSYGYVYRNNAIVEYTVYIGSAKYY